MATETQIAIPGAEQFQKQNTAMSLIERALLDPSLSADKVAALLEVQLKYEANEARRRFEEAFQQFKRNAPAILKTKAVGFGTKGGKSEVSYSHAELDKITPIITESLLAHGITHHWRTGEENGRTTVTCVLEGFGHTREAAKLSGPPDTSGGKNNIQAIGSTVTYLERYTLLAATGIAAKGQDDDGKTEGLSEMAITDYLVAISDAGDITALQKAFAEAYTAARHANDLSAQQRFVSAKEAKKKELREFGQ